MQIEIPFIKPTHSTNVYVFSIEGCNGAGKTTLLNKYMLEHPDTECRLCVPDIYQTAKEMKHFMLFESSQLCSALYYLAGAVEIYNTHNNKYSKVLFDRSIWSTFAAAYAKDETILPILFNCLNSIKEQIFLPDLIIVLDVSYEVATVRISKTKVGGEFDKDDKEECIRKKGFYKLLKDAGYPVVFIDVNEIDAEEVYSKSIQIMDDLCGNDKRQTCLNAEKITDIFQ